MPPHYPKRYPILGCPKITIVCRVSRHTMQKSRTQDAEYKRTIGRHFAYTSSEGYCVLRQPSGNKGGTICSRASERERRFGVPFQSVCRTRSHRMKFCVQGAWGRCPQQADSRKCECVLTLALLAGFVCG